MYLRLRRQLEPNMKIEIKINNKEIMYLNFSIDIQFQSQLTQYDSL